MKKLSLILLTGLCASIPALCTSCGTSTDYKVGVCQLMVHDSLDKATRGFEETLKASIESAGKTISIDVQVAGETTLCPSIINVFTAKNVDLIMANATPALLAASNATETIPVLGTSVTDYNDTFNNNIPNNVSGTSDAVDFAAQAQMMIETLNLKEGDKVGVLYCINESNSLIQYNAVSELFSEKNITTTAYTFSEISELQGVVNKMVTEVKAVYVPSDNTVAANDTVVGTICKDKKVPVFTSYGGEICYASLAIDYYQLGVETAKMAADILLNGKEVKDIPIKTLTPTTVYNEELCQELGIEIK